MVHASSRVGPRWPLWIKESKMQGWRSSRERTGSSLNLTIGSMGSMPVESWNRWVRTSFRFSRLVRGCVSRRRWPLYRWSMWCLRFWGSSNSGRGRCRTPFISDNMRLKNTKKLKLKLKITGWLSNVKSIAFSGFWAKRVTCLAGDSVFVHLDGTKWRMGPKNKQLVVWGLDCKH